MNPKRITEYLYNNSIDLSKRLYSLVVAVSTIILVISTTVVFIAGGYQPDLLNLLGIIAVVIISGVIFWKTNRITLGSVFQVCLISFILFPISFFNGSGASGSGPIWFIYGMVLTGILLKGKLRSIIFYLNIAFGIACYAVSYFWPEYIKGTDTLVTYIYTFTVLILVSGGIGSVLTLEDRLFRIQAELAAKQRKEIESLVASQNRFFSSMSHEIRTPINTIIGLNEMILREDISDEVAEDAANIRVSGKLLLNLINDILDMSKFEAGDMHLLIDSYSTGDMLSDLVGMLWIRAKEKNLDFHINVAPDLPSELIGDEVRIKQILMNILNNAIKYTKEGSISLSVECEKKDNNIYNIVYTVSDTGMGIKKEDIPYLFTAFKRVDESKNRHIEGTGLGLSIVKQFVDMMGGKITVNSVYTKGSSFTVEIPQKAASNTLIGDTDYEARHAKSARVNYKQKFEAPEARILAVDDNKSNLLVVTKLLRDTKVQIDTALSGEDALKMTLNKYYDVIFMDHLMPEMDGIECYENIQKQVGGKCKTSKVVILTANAGEENKELYARSGFDGYLIKPVSGIDLERELIRLLPANIVHITSDGEDIIKDTVSWMHANQKKRRVAITTESVADLPLEIIQKYNIGILPHYVRTSEGTIFKDGVEIDTIGVLGYLEDTSHSMLPEAPSVKEHEEFFANQLETANNVIHLSISGGIANSGCPVAMEAAKSFDNVTVIDSSHLSSGLGLLTLIACYLVDAGKSAEEIVAGINQFKSSIHTSFIVDNLDFLARTKQISQSTASIFRSFMIRPVLTLNKGVIKTDHMYLGNIREAWKKYIKTCLASPKINTGILFVTYVGLSKKDLDWIRDEIEKRKHFDSIYFQMASPAIATNCGPGTFGLLYMEIETDFNK